MILEKIKIKFLGKTPKRVELPIPFVQKCEKTGEVICDPIGEFSYEDGIRLLEISGKDGLFKLVGELPANASTEIKEDLKAGEPEHEKHFCECCGKEIPWKKHHITMPPRFLVGHSMKHSKRAKEEEAPSPLL